MNTAWDHVSRVARGRADQARAHAAGTWRSWRGRAPLLHKVLGALALIVVLGLLATLLVWSLLIGSVVALGVLLALGVRRVWRRFSGDAGARDPARSNVRVLRRGP